MLENQNTPHQDIVIIRKEIGDIRITVNEVKEALVGNGLAKDGGLVQRIIDTETRQDELEKRFNTIEKNEDKRALYVHIIWAMGGVIATAIVVALIRHFIPSM